MKKLITLVIGLGLILSLNAEGAPFYKVKCYDAKNRQISCDDIAKVKKKRKYIKVKKKSKKRYTKKRKRRLSKKQRLAARKRRARAIAMRELAKENKKLKEDMISLRKATLIAAAKTEEKPTSAKLAAKTQIKVPITTTKIEIAKEVEEKKEEEGKFNFELAVENSKKNKVATPFVSDFYFDFIYNATKQLVLTLEQPFTLQYYGGETDNSFVVGDTLLLFTHGPYYKYKNISIDTNYYIWFPTSSASRADGKYLAFRIRPRIKTTFNHAKTYARFEPEINFTYRRSTTSSPTATSVEDLGTEAYKGAGGLLYEKLAPYEQFSLALNTKVVHSFTKKVAGEISLKFKGAKLYADTAVYEGGTETIEPGKWNHTMELVFPRLNFQFSESISAAAWLSATGPVATFKPYITDANNTLSFWFRIAASI